METNLILSQFEPVDDVHKAYRERVQKYADEEKNILEEIKHGVVFGSRAFVDRIKNDYLADKDLKDVIGQNKILNDLSVRDIIKTASEVLNADIDKWKMKRRIGKSDVINRDMLIFLLWQKGCFSNTEIGAQLGLGTASISRRVGFFRDMLGKDQKLQQKYENFKSIVKV